MKRLVFITLEDSYPGFSLAGAEQHIASRETVERLVEDAINNPEIGLLIIDERLIEGIKEEKIKDIEERWQGILLTLPAPERVSIEKDYIMSYIIRTMGYQIRIMP